MGLDIYLYEIDPNGDNTVENDPSYPNKYRDALFENFKDHVINKESDGFDIEAMFASRGLSHKDWSLLSTIYDVIETDSGLAFTYQNDLTGEQIKFTKDQLINVKITTLVLSVREIGYQRKSMVNSFYTEILSGCWYVTGDIDKDSADSMDVVFDNDQLAKVKIHAVAGSPILNWSLGPNQFIYFCY